MRLLEAPRSRLPSTVLISVSLLAAVVVNHLVAAAASELSDSFNGEILPTLVDTKFWIGNTEFDDKLNWLDQRKPCHLLEKILIDEQSVVSVASNGFLGGFFMDSSVKDLGLAPNGMLLLEEDSVSGSSLEPALIDYLNQTGECHDSETDKLIYRFEPYSDHLSWFNPQNWASNFSQTLASRHQLIPESNSVPCNSDLVVFGDKLAVSLGLVSGFYELGDTFTFKINFKAHEALVAAEEGGDKLESISNLRVAKLRIGDKEYNQKEFYNLMTSDLYEDSILFDFNNSNNILKSMDRNGLINEQSFSSLFTIDDSSVKQSDSSTQTHYCHDEAGCYCGNEDPIVMKAICSFNSPLEDYPCNDPIEATGFCNRICGTTISLVIDPSRFKEDLLKVIEYKKEHLFSDYPGVFGFARRTSETSYEIVHRPVFIDDESFAATVGNELICAQIIYEHLIDPATKSLYGIKSIKMESSIDWRRNSRVSTFWSSFLLMFSITLVCLLYQVSDINLSRRRVTSNDQDNMSDFFANLEEQIILDNLENTSSLDETVAIPSKTYVRLERKQC